MNADQLIHWCHEHHATVKFKSNGVELEVRNYPTHLAPTLEMAVKGQEKCEAERAFLQTVSREDRSLVMSLLLAYDSTRNDCGLSDQEKESLVKMTGKYPEMVKYL